MQAAEGKFNPHIHVEYEWSLRLEEMDESDDDLDDKVSFSTLLTHCSQDSSGKWNANVFASTLSCNICNFAVGEVSCTLTTGLKLENPLSFTQGVHARSSRTIQPGFLSHHAETADRNPSWTVSFRGWVWKPLA